MNMMYDMGSLSSVQWLLVILTVYIYIYTLFGIADVDRK